MSLVVIALSTAAAAGAPPAAPPAASTIKVTEIDVRMCLGVDGSKPEDQIRTCTKILATGKVKPPLTADYLATRAAAYFALDQLTPALADMNKALAIRQSPELYFERALIQTARRDEKAAKQDLAQVIKLAPEFAPAHFISGILAYRAGDHAAALTDFNAAVARGPAYYQALFARGLAKRKLGDDMGGAKDIADARGMRPNVDDDLKPFGMTP